MLCGNVKCQNVCSYNIQNIMLEMPTKCNMQQQAFIKRVDVTKLMKDVLFTQETRPYVPTFSASHLKGVTIFSRLFVTPFLPYSRYLVLCRGGTAASSCWLVALQRYYY